MFVYATLNVSTFYFSNLKSYIKLYIILYNVFISKKKKKNKNKEN